MRGGLARVLDAYPDYRNVFDHADVRDDEVVIEGRSECSEPALAGPALWSIRIAGDKVREWRVYEDSPRNRRDLGLKGTT